jgi:hypothetical protein
VDEGRDKTGWGGDNEQEVWAEKGAGGKVTYLSIGMLAPSGATDTLSV